MSRKAREDKSNWLQPSLHVFTGDYGPFKIRNHATITNVLVILTSTLQDEEVNKKKVDKKKKKSRKKVASSGGDGDGTGGGGSSMMCRHPMYPYAGLAQKLLLDDEEQQQQYVCSSNDNPDNSNSEEKKQSAGCESDTWAWYHEKHFRHILIVDVAAMVEEVKEEDGGSISRGAVLKNMIQREMESSEPVKGFGKPLHRLLQRLNLQNVTLMAEGELCCVVLKLYDAFLREDRDITLASDICLVHPEISANFVNKVLVPMDNNSIGNPDKPSSLNMHLIFQDKKTCDKRLGMIRHVFPNGVTDIVSPKESGSHKQGGLSLLLSMIGNRHLAAHDDTPMIYTPDYCNDVGRSLYLSTLSVDMNKHSKQYERTTKDITAELLKVEHVADDTSKLDLTSLDWNKCERHVGALVLRGNRCVLCRSLSGEWEGMRFPSIVPKQNESAKDAAIRSVVEFTGVEASEVTPLEMISPVTVYAPNGKDIVVLLHPLYATSPPPDGALEDADVEDDESPYDWYLFANAVNRLDERSVAALRSMSSILVEAANVGILPCKWGGVFGQEIKTVGASDGDVLFDDTARNIDLIVQAEEWKPSRQADMLQDVRKANADILSRLSTSRKLDGQPYKLPVTILSGFLGSGKTTLMSHILSNYDGLKIALLVNDMGEINIDAALLKKHSVSVTQKEEHMVEMSNGCICCTLREDLLVEVAKIASQGVFDYLLIESTGVSEPMPVAETFTFEDSTGLCLGDISEIDTLVTVVDGSKFLSELDSVQTLRDRDWQADPEDQRTIAHLLCNQVEFANVVLLNKCDQIDEEERKKVKRVIQQMNPTAQLIETVYSEVPLTRVLGTGLFSLSDAEQNDRWLKEARIGEHTPETIEYGITSFTYRARKPFWPHKLDLALQDMLNRVPPFDKNVILRSKGIVWLASFTGLQGEFSLAGNHFTLVPGNPWWAEIEKEDWPEGLEDALEPLWYEPHGDRQQEIVIIGQSLDRDVVTKILDACLLSDDEMKMGEEAWNHISVDAGDPFYEDWYNAIEAAPIGEEDHGHSHDHHHHDVHEH